MAYKTLLYRRDGRIARIGIQKSPFPPFRLHLVNCLLCGTTLTTKSLRAFLESRGTPPRGARPPRRLAG